VYAIEGLRESLGSDPVLGLWQSFFHHSRFERLEHFPIDREERLRSAVQQSGPQRVSSKMSNVQINTAGVKAGTPVSGRSSGYGASGRPADIGKISVVRCPSCQNHWARKSR